MRPTLLGERDFLYDEVPPLSEGLPRRPSSDSGAPVTERDRNENQTIHSIGRYRKWTVHLSVRADPSLEADAPEEFAVNLFVSRPDGVDVDVARIDTSHFGVHYDRLYLPVDDPLRKDYSVDIVDYREAQRVLLENWRRHVEVYEENHGLSVSGSEDGE